MRNRRPLDLVLLCYLLSALQAQPISDSDSISLAATPACKSNEFLKNCFLCKQECLPCTESCLSCTMTFFFGIKTGETCLQCADDSILTDKSCKPKCTAPAVWDSQVQDCQILTLRAIKDTVYHCQQISITSSLSNPDTNVFNQDWKSGLANLYPGHENYVGSYQYDGSSAILHQQFYKEMQISKPTVIDYELALQFSNGKTIKASISITFVPQGVPNILYDDTTNGIVYASKPFQLNMMFRDDCGDPNPLYVGPNNFTCWLQGKGYEQGLRLPGPCQIKASQLYGDSDYLLLMSYGYTENGSYYSLVDYGWAFKTQNYDDDPVKCDFFIGRKTFYGKKSPLIFDPPTCWGPNSTAYWIRTHPYSVYSQVNYILGSGQKLYVPFTVNDYDREFELRFVVDSPPESEYVTWVKVTVKK